MAIGYNEKDLEAIEKKLENPSAVVLCPRCGRELVYKEFKTGCEVECPTDSCIREVVRGI